MEKEKEPETRKLHKALLVISVLALIALIVISTNLALYINFLLGNDIVVKMRIDNETLFLLNGQSQNITLLAQVSANPFCSAKCRILFEDLSQNLTLNSEEATIAASKPISKSYKISAEKFGSGIELYRLRTECANEQKPLCHGKDTPTQRSVLITMSYAPTAEQIALQGKIKEDIEGLKKTIELLEQTKNELSQMLQQQASVLDITQEKESLAKLQAQIGSHEIELGSLQRAWNAQDIERIESEFKTANQSVSKTHEELLRIFQASASVQEQYNRAAHELNESKELLEKARAAKTLSSKVHEDTSKAIDEFNIAVQKFNESKNITVKSQIASEQLELAKKIFEQIKKKQRQEALAIRLELDLKEMTLCKITKSCAQNFITLRNLSEPLELEASCSQEIEFSSNLKALNSSMNFTREGYPQLDEFWKNASSILEQEQNKIRKEIREQISGTTENEHLANIIFEDKPQPQSQIAEYNLTAALISSLLQKEQIYCVFKSQNINNTKDIPIALPKISSSEPVKIDITFDPQNPVCCVKGVCGDCCTHKSCAMQNYPIVFLNGHAFNKGVSAEYSLDSLNELQNAIEEQGYINAGTITLYTQKESANGLWGAMQSPVSIRASYYFDLFETPENYVIVQTKNQNIDTDAIRLKELLDTISLKTGKEKSIIIAHSMGGLVARRYMQLFGESKISRLILIGTPNSGITKTTHEYCTVLGTVDECNDMLEGSVFMQKLSAAPSLTIPVYSIVGTGCTMQGEDGDGIVLSKNARLNGAHNIILNGTCEGTNILHVQMLRLSKHPEIEGIIKEVLEERKK